MITNSKFGTLTNGQTVDVYTLTNKQGVQVEIMTLGATLKSWNLPTKAGQSDIVLGFDTLAEYEADQSAVGAIVGRYANRICEGKFSLNGNHYQADINQAGNCLHGGSHGFNDYVWHAEILSKTDNPSIALEMTSADGDQGFPGEIHVKVIYTLTDTNSLRIEYFAKSDKDTIFNPTNHAYFNLNGHDSGDVHEHLVSVVASHYTPTNENSIPTGDIVLVENSPFDLRKPTLLKHALTSNDAKITSNNGLDHNFCLDNFAPTQENAIFAGVTSSETSAVKMEIFTSMPGLQIFTANHFEDIPGKNGATYQAHHGVCFESQFYPNSPNEDNFPNATLAANKEFYSVTEYKVSF